FSIRSRALARLSLERGRHRRNFRPQRPTLFCVRVLERARPVFERAAFRRERAGRKSRRRREGTLLVPRQYADAQLHADDLSLSAIAFSLRRAGRAKRRSLKNG